MLSGPARKHAVLEHAHPLPRESMPPPARHSRLAFYATQSPTLAWRIGILCSGVFARSLQCRKLTPVKSAVTICLVPEARSGPFVFHDGLADGCSRAASHGFDAVEILPRSADEVDAAELRALLASHGLSVAAFGTGAGWIVRKLSLTAADEAVRVEARKFIRAIIDLAG